MKRRLKAPLFFTRIYIEAFLREELREKSKTSSISDRLRLEEFHRNVSYQFLQIKSSGENHVKVYSLFIELLTLWPRLK